MSENNSLKRSKKRQESGIQGKHYERKILALTALKCFLDKDVKDFWVLSNPSDIEKFDDVIVLTELSNGEEKLFLIQIKHKEQGKSRPIGADRLDSQDKSLSLRCYETAFYKIIENKEFVKTNSISSETDMYFILFSNCKIFHEKQNDNIGFNSCPNECFSFIDTSSDPKNTFKITKKSDKYNQNFFDKFYFYTDQLDEESINEEICALLGVSNDIATEIIQFFYSWVEPKECIKLSKFDVKVKLLDILTRDIQPPCSLETITESILIHLINEFDVTVIVLDKSSAIIWKDIMHEVQLFCEDFTLNLSDWEKCTSGVIEKKLSPYFGNKETIGKNITIRLVYILMVVQRKVPFFITTSNRFFDCFKDKLLVALDVFSVVLKVTNDDLTFLDLRVFQTLNDIDIKSNYSKFSRKLKVSFQGKPDIALCSLIKNNKYLKQKMSVDNYIDFLYNTCVIGEVNELPMYYINRQINVPMLKYDILDEVEALIFIFNLPKNRAIFEKYLVIDFIFFLDQLSDEVYLKPGRVISIDNYEYGSNITQLIEKHTQERTFYILNYVDPHFLSLLHTNGSIEVLRKHLTTISKKDTDFMHIYKNCHVNVICNNAGMGKSMFLNFINSKLLPDEWAVYIDLKKYSSGNKKIRTVNDLINFSYKCQSEHVNETLHSFLESLYNNLKHKIIWLIDDYEEVNQPELLELFKLASKEGFRIWIVARPSLKLELENMFRIFSMELIEFDEDDQEMFIKKYLKQKNKTKNHIQKIMGAIDNIRHLFEESFIGVCQQTMMVTEIFLNYRKNWKEHEWHIHNIYEKFIELKVADNYGVQREFYIRTVSKLALKVFFKDEALKNVFDLQEFTEDVRLFKETYKKDFFITEFAEDDVPIFSHRTYAEFLAARWLLHTIKKQINQETPFTTDGIFPMLYMKELSAVRLFLDNLLANDVPTHSAIINKEEHKIKEIRGPIWHLRVDLLKRSVFHLLSSRGRYFDIGAASGIENRIRNLDVRSQVINKGKHILLMPVDSVIANEWNASILSNFLNALDVQLIKEILRKDALGCNCFDYTILSGSLLELNTLLDLSIEPPITLPQYTIYFLLYHSIKNGYHNILHMLDVQGLINVKIGQNEMSLMHLAVVSKNIKAVDKLMKAHYLEAWGVDREENTPFHIACSQKDGALLEYFYKLENIDIDFLNKRNLKGQTPLHFLARQGHAKWIKKFIEKFPGTNVDAKCCNGNTPFTVSIIFYKIQVAVVLRSHRAKVHQINNKKMTALHYAASEDFVKCVELLLQWKADVNRKDINGMTPLMKAAIWGHTSIVKILLDNNAKVNLRNNARWTALHFAVTKNHVNIIELLLKSEAEVNCKNNNGDTPLTIACRNKLPEAIELIISHDSSNAK